MRTLEANESPVRLLPANLEAGAGESEWLLRNPAGRRGGPPAGLCI